MNTHAQDSFTVDGVGNDNEQNDDDAEDSERRDSFPIYNAGRSSTGSGATPPTFRRPFAARDAQSFHDLEFVSKQVKGIPELHHKEDAQQWLADIELHLDHLLHLPGLVYALKTKIRGAEVKQALDDACAAPAYREARQRGDYPAAFQLVAKGLRGTNAGKEKELYRAVWRQTRRQGFPQGERQRKIELRDPTKAAAARFHKDLRQATLEGVPVPCATCAPHLFRANLLPHHLDYLQLHAPSMVAVADVTEVLTAYEQTGVALHAASLPPPPAPTEPATANRISASTLPKELVRAGRDGNTFDFYCDPKEQGCGKFGHSALFCPDRTNSQPRTIVNQVTADGLDVDALFKAAAMLDGGDEDAVAVMKQMYVKHAEENAAAKETTSS